MKPLRYIAKSDGPQSGYWKVIDTKTGEVKQVTMSGSAAGGIAASLNKENRVMKRSQLATIVKEELAKMMHEVKSPRYIATSDGMQRGYYKVVDTQTGKTVLTTGSHVAAGREAQALNQSGPRGISGSVTKETVDQRGWTEEEKETYRDNLRSRRAARDRENAVRAQHGKPPLKTHNPNPRHLPGQDPRTEVKAHTNLGESDSQLAQYNRKRLAAMDVQDKKNAEIDAGHAAERRRIMRKQNQEKNRNRAGFQGERPPKTEVKAQPISLRCPKCNSSGILNQPAATTYYCTDCGHRWNKSDAVKPSQDPLFKKEALRDDDTRSFDDVVFAYLDKQKASGVTDGMTLAKSIKVKFGFQLKQAKLMVIQWAESKK